MASKQKRDATEEEAPGSSPKRRGAMGEEGPSGISGMGELGVDQGPCDKVNGDGSSEMEVLDQVEGEEDRQDGNEHPLLIPLILETVLQYTGTLEEVKRNRLVCKTWMHVSDGQWTSLTKTLTLFRNETLPQEAGTPSDEAVMTLQQLREMCAGTKSALEKVVLYRKFKFQSWTFDADLLQALNMINQTITTTDRWFWNRIAPSFIKTLTLEGCHFPVRFMPFEECVLKALPNLESLSVTNCTANPGDPNVSTLLYRELPAMLDEEFGQRANSGYKHQNLKLVRLSAPKQCDQIIQSMSLIPFLRMVSNLEGFWIEGLHLLFQDIILRALLFEMVDYSLNRTLKKLHLLDFSTITYTNQSSDIFPDLGRGYAIFRYDNLEELHFDVGYGPENEHQMVFIQNNMPALQKLHLYRAPLSQPLVNFLEGQRMETLTELHLWGNLSSSLGFLNALPNLQVLKWVTSCYEEKFHGYRVTGVTTVMDKSEQLRTYPLLLKDLISQSEEVNTLEHLTTFELDCGPISGTSWNLLGLWMPNLKNFKGIVSNVEYLGIMHEQWKQLETLELAHGSELPGGELFKELIKFKGILKSFQWKGCACTRKLFGKRVISGLQETEKKLGSQLPENCTFPWNANLEGDEADVCKHAAFEETLMSKAVSSM